MTNRLKNHEIEVSFIRASGKGGQNRNKRFSGVRVVHLSTGLVGLATERRSQAQNLSVAKERLKRKLDAFYYRPTVRVATRRTLASKEQRIADKVRLSRKKKERQLKDE